MIAMAYPLSIDERIQPFYDGREIDYDVFADGTLMVYPTDNGSGMLVIERDESYGSIIVTIAEDSEYDQWRIFVDTFQKCYNDVIVTEAEYLSYGGHNPMWRLQNRFVNGIAQPINYND